MRPLALTLGDPAGIGPELALALWVKRKALGVPAFILPTPSSMIMALYRGTESGIYLQHLWVTLSETVEDSCGS